LFLLTKSFHNSWVGGDRADSGEIRDDVSDKNKLHFEEIPDYKFHFIIPYFVLTALLTYYAIQLINYDKKQ
jgi:hypothetical protein